MTMTDTESAPILRVDELTVAYRDTRRRQLVRVVDEVSLVIHRGEAVGLAGESGCGKSTLAVALLDVLPPGMQRLRGEIQLNSRERTIMIERATPSELLAARWDVASIVFQGAMN